MIVKHLKFLKSQKHYVEVQRIYFALQTGGKQ